MNLDAFSKSAEKSEKATSKLDDVMRSLNPSALSAVAGVTALVGAFKGLIGLGSGVVDMASHFETVRTELGTVLQDAQKGAELFEDLRKFSFETTFGVDELADASKQLLNAGVNTKNLQKELKTLGDLAGGSKGKFAELSAIYSKILTSGRATAIQLNQFNLRGIPITKTLKEMGVTGVATAEQLQQAFQKLTDEGGQFHNAMDNIIDTIEGKRGFITDTLKEIQVNLGDVTGLTDAYKKSLDVIYEVLNNFNNALMKINDNPLLKAFVTGLAVATVSSLVVLIGSSLVSALGMVATKLGIIAGLKAIISSPVGWITLGVAGIAGAIAGVVSYTNAQKDLEVQAIKTQDALKGLVPDVKKNKTYDENKSYAETMIQILNDNIKGYKEELEKANEEMQSWSTEWNGGGEENAREIFGINDLEEKIKNATSALKKWNNELEEYNRLEKAGKEVKDLESEFNRIFGETDMGKRENEIKSIVNDIQKLKDLLGKDGTVINGSVFKLTNERKSQIDETIKYLEQKLDELYGKEVKRNWWEIFEDVTGVKGEKNLKGNYSGKYQGETYRSNIMNDYYNQVARGMAMGMGSDYDKELAKQFVSGIQSQIQTLLDTGDFNMWDNSIGEMIKTIDNFNNIINGNAEGVEENSKNWIESMDYVSGSLFSMATSMSGDFSRALEGFAQSGSVWGAIINVVLGAFKQVASECDKFDKAMNPITANFGHLKKYIANVIEVFGEMSEGVESIIIVIGSLFELLEPVSKAITAFTKVMNLLVKSISYLIKGLLEWVGKLINTDKLTKAIEDFIESVDSAGSVLDDKLGIDDLEDITKDLTNEYKALLDAMIEYEEWYIENKKQLNADAYKYNYQKVNDMIITPSGKFSTAPDDFIIATKNPAGLGAGSTNNVVVQNNYANNAEVQIKEQDNGLGGKDMLVVISRKIASDVANGSNGWDSALAQQQYRMAGRRVGI